MKLTLAPSLETASSYVHSCDTIPAFDEQTDETDRNALARQRSAELRAVKIGKARHNTPRYTK